MMLNWKKPVWHDNKHAPGNTAKLVHKERLIFQAADMFQDSIRCRDIKGIVGKRQSDIWLNLGIANERKSLLKLNSSAQSARSDIFLMRVTSLQHICAVIYNVRHTDIQNLVRVRRLYMGAKVPENTIPGRNKELLCHAAR